MVNTATKMGMLAALVLCMGLMVLGNRPARAETGAGGFQLAQAGIDDAAPRRRPRTRLHIRRYYDPDEVYPRYFPGANAVRDCRVAYVREFRPSGTVIVPRMSCRWRRR